MIIIMNKGQVYNGLYFENEQMARNYIKWSHPHKRWTDMPNNCLKCKRTGMVMQVVELTPYQSIETKSYPKAIPEPVKASMFSADTYDYLQYKKDKAD